MKISAAVMYDTAKPLSIDHIELATPKSKEVLVKVMATGVCHSDYNALHDSSTPTPSVLGHEGAGIVVSTGSEVQTVKPGDHVVLSWVPFCGTCDFCQTGQVNLCESAFGPMFEGTLLDGTSRLSKNGQPMFHYSLLSTFAEYTVVPEMSCIKIPKEMPFAQASLIGCGVATGYGAAVHAAGVKPGSAVAVFGIGGVGINAIQGAKLAGASKIIACDIKPQNIELAKQYGATHSINAAEEDAVEAIKALTDGCGVHYTVDCSGSTISAETAWKSTRKGGTSVFVGAFNPAKHLEIPAGGFHRAGKILKGSFYGDVHPFRDFPVISQLYLDGKINLDDLVIDRIKLEDINQAFETFHDKSAVNVGRVIVEFEGE